MEKARELQEQANDAVKYAQPAQSRLCGHQRCSFYGQAYQAQASETEDAQPQVDIDSDDDRLNSITDNCDQVRRKIRALINSGEMRVGEFQKAANAYGRFMGQSGKYKGDGCDTYIQAARFFKKRELAGIKPPKKKKASKADEDKKHDVSDIHLDGEETGDVPVYDTCRKKINAYLRQDGVTQAGFLREIAKTFGDGRKLQGKLLTDFLGKRGPNAGNTSSVFYAAYVFFEKIRIRDGKPKSKAREEMERIWDGSENWKNGGKPGFDRTTPSRNRAWVAADEIPVLDKYGQVSIQKK
ncbi:hypothetical protein HK104_008907 [Borealophlyctis nickersoniae]|nr:hypothetical protein HK104_008907 [Borealophlyctis nickersoniae]